MFSADLTETEQYLRTQEGWVISELLLLLKETATLEGFFRLFSLILSSFFPLVIFLFAKTTVHYFDELLLLINCMVVSSVWRITLIHRVKIRRETLKES